ncbi:MAG: hypothetical protein ACRCTF_00055 [Bacteroidales bacterium]
MKKLLFTIVVSATLTSCYVPSTIYKVNAELSNVEVPSDATTQFGESKIVKLDVDGKTNYKYEDDYIDISWFVGLSNFSFTLNNKSNYSIKIPWDDAAYVDVNGIAGRVMHAGVKYTERNNSQIASVVPKRASIKDVIIPTENVYLVNGQYIEGRLFKLPVDSTNIEEAKGIYVGKTVRVLFPVIIQDVKNEYVFEFKIDDITKR